MTHPTPVPTWHAVSTSVAGRVVRFQTRPGLGTGNEPSRAALLLCEYAAAHSPQVLLVCDVTYALPALCVPEQTQLIIAERPAGMHRAGVRTLGSRLATWLPDGGCVVPDTIGADLVLIEASATREAWQRRLLQGYHALAVGGTLVAAAPNDAGGTQLAKDVNAVFGSCTERSKAHQRMVIAVKTAQKSDMPAFAQRMGIAAGTHTTVEHDGRAYTTLPGVFAHGRLDAGSAFLLAHLPEQGWRTVLDLGAGAGVLGGWALDHGATRVDAIEVDGVAAWCHAQTFANDERVRTAWHDVHDPLPWNDQYDRVVVNPPFHTGRRHDDRLFRTFAARAAGCLRPRGEFWCVANAFLPYQTVMASYWTDVTTIATNGSYTVWRARGRVRGDTPNTETTEYIDIW